MLKSVYALSIGLLVSACSLPKAPYQPANDLSPDLTGFSVVWLHWQPANPWQRWTKMGSSKIYESTVELGELGYGEHALILMKPGNRMLLVVKTENGWIDQSPEQKIVIPLRLQEGEVKTVTFWQDIDRVYGTWEKPIYSVTEGMEDFIRTTPRAFFHRPTSVEIR